jgi:hypothetical protein
VSPTPPADPRLTQSLLRQVTDRRMRRRTSAYSGWPQRRAADRRLMRWPMELKDPEAALLRLIEDPDPASMPADLNFNWRAWTPAQKRAAVRVVLVALALEDA